MANRVFGLDSVVKNFSMISEEARKISAALAVQEAGSCLQGGFLTYAFACHNLMVKSASLRAANKVLDAELQGLAGRVQAAYAKIAPSEFLNAIRENDVKTLDKILKISGLHSKKMSNGELPLHYAIRCGSQDVVKYLLDTARVNPLSKDHQGLTAFDHAFLSQDRSVVALVLGASLGTTVPDHLLDIGIDPAEIQVMQQQMRQLLHPPIPNLSPPHAAAFMGDIRALEKLSKESDIRGSDLVGMTALHYGALSGKEDVVKWLLAKGAKLDGKAASGMNLLHLAAIGGSESVMKLLLDTKKLDPNVADEAGRTPLHFAMTADHLAAARLLVEKGGDLQAKTMRTMPISILSVLSQVRAIQRDPLKLNSSALWTFSFFASAALFRYFGYSITSQFFSALPVLGELLKHSINNRSAWQRLAGSFSITYATIGYLSQSEATKSVFEGFHTVQLGRTLIDHLRACWKNSGVETYRPLRNALIYSANFLFSGWEFLQTSGIKKHLVCQFGTHDQCLMQEKLNPIWQDRCQQLAKNYAKCKKDCSLDPNDPVCQNPCPAAPKNDTECKPINLAANAQAKADADLVLRLGGYGSNKTAKKARDTLALEYHPDKCKGRLGNDATCQAMFVKLEAAYETFKNWQNLNKNSVTP